MNPIYTSLGGLLCPASLLIGYMIILIGYQTDAAKFTNHWDEEDDDDAKP